MTDLDTSAPWQARAKGAQEVAMEYLLHQLHSGRFRAGEQIVPEAIAAEIGVSHVPVREAIRTLEGRGTLTHRPRKGYFVTELDIEDLDTLATLGDLLETEALRRCVPVIDADQISRMSGAIDEGRSQVGESPIAVAAACRSFHRIMLERGVPRLLHTHLNLMWSSMEPYRPLLYAAVPNQQASCAEHEEILAAIADGDLARAIQAYDEHRNNVLGALRVLIELARPE